MLIILGGWAGKGKGKGRRLRDVSKRGACVMRARTRYAAAGRSVGVIATTTKKNTHRERYLTEKNLFFTHHIPKKNKTILCIAS